MRFEFSTANRIIYGAGSCHEIPSLVSTLGKHAFVVMDSRERVAPLLDALEASGLVLNLFEVKKEPDINSVLMAIRILLTLSDRPLFQQWHSPLILAREIQYHKVQKPRSGQYP